MTDMAEKSDTSNGNNSETGAIGKITPVQIEAEQSKIVNQSLESGQQESLNKGESERDLLTVTRALLREHGIRKSAAAIRDAVEMPHDLFTPKMAVEALSNLGFKASFGSLKFGKITEELLPAMAFMKDGRGVLIKEIQDDENLIVLDPRNGNKSHAASIDSVKAEYSGFVILAKRLNRREREERSGHWFYSAFRKSKWLYVQVLMAALISNFLSLATTLFTITVYDRVIPNGAMESLMALAIGVVIAVGFDFVIKSLRARFIDIASKRADLEISRRLFDRILSLSPNEQKQHTGAMAGTIKEFETLREFFNSSTLVILIDLPFAIFFIYVIYLFAGPLAYVPMTAVPVVILLGIGLQPFLSRITRNVVESGMNKQSVLVETLNGLETVNATGSGKLMRKRYEDALNNQSSSGQRIRNLSSFLVNSAASVQQFAQVATIFFGVYLVIDGTISQGALIGAMILGGRTMAPLSQLANTLSRVNGALAAFRNLDKLIGKKYNSAEDLSPISRPNFVGEIEFRNVSYKFDGAQHPTVKNLSLKIPAGQTVALVGKMGSGKSTISRLVAGILEPTEGAILIDGVDVRQIDKSDLRKNIGVMLQDSWLFSGTVRENIQMGNSEYDDDHLLEICKISGVDDFVGSNPAGYDLEIRERGVGLSGGQRQTINLARSLLHEPQILLLDEPTSAMDQNTEARIVESLESLGKDKTMLVVTHRNPILKIADRVLVIENGQVIADQTPEQLGLKKA